jgi:hypothetical protein
MQNLRTWIPTLIPEPVRRLRVLPMPVPGMGWFSACKDPQGNEFGLWQIDTSAPAPAQ